MSVYHRFGPADIVHYELNTQPRVVLASGTSGWRGSTGTSGSISMYGGIRSKETANGNELTIQPVFNLETYTIDGEIQLSASYPFTGSVQLTKVRDVELAKTDITNVDWGDEHFRPILNLYEYYSRFNADYVTSSYDYYCLYSEPGGLAADGESQNQVVYTDNAVYDTMSSSFTIEMRIKPLVVSGSGRNQWLISRDTQWVFYIQDSDGRLAFSSSAGDLSTSSLAVDKCRWQHVSFRQDATGNGKFTIDMIDAGTTTGLTDISAGVNQLTLFGNNDATAQQTYHGMMYELRLWNVDRTVAQLSASFDNILLMSSSANLVLYSRFNDGPFGTAHGGTKGSGTFDYSNTANHSTAFNNFARQNHGVVWLPNDDVGFTTKKTLVSGDVGVMRVLHVPSMYYGRQIATGSVRIIDNSFMSSSLVRTLVDDGRGGLYVSGSLCSSSIEEREEYAGVKWPKVGNVFYSEGVIVIKDPAIIDWAEGQGSLIPNDTLQVSFRGQQKIPTKVFMCRINGAAANASNNPSYTTYDSGSDKLRVIRDDPTTYVTAVGLYNKERKLVGVAKVAQPTRNRERDKINIRLKMDF